MSDLYVIKQGEDVLATIQVGQPIDKLKNNPALNSVINLGDLEEYEDGFITEQMIQNISDQGVTIEQVAQPYYGEGVTGGSFRQSVNILKYKYNIDDPSYLCEKFDTNPDNTYRVKEGDTLYTIAYEQLEKEGFSSPNDGMVQERAAQIAVINGLKDVTNLEEGEYLVTSLTDDAVRELNNNNYTYVFMKLDKQETKSDADNSYIENNLNEEVLESDEEELDEYVEDYTEYSEYEDEEDDETPAVSSSSGYVNNGGNYNAVSSDDDLYSNNQSDDYSYSVDNSSGSTVNGDSEEVDYTNMDNVDSDDESNDDASENASVSQSAPKSTGSNPATKIVSASAYGTPKILDNPLTGWTIATPKDWVNDPANLTEAENKEKGKLNGTRMLGEYPVKIDKYKKDGQFKYALNLGTPNGSITIAADTIEELEKIIEKFNNVFSGSYGEIKELLEMTGNDKNVFKLIAQNLYDNWRNNNDNTEYKTAIKEMLKTKDPEVVSILLENGSSRCVIKDEETAEIVAGLFKEIRDKEKSGAALNAEEIKLKATLSRLSNGVNGDGNPNELYALEDGIKIYMDSDGNIVYEKECGSEGSKIAFRAQSKENLGNIIKDYEEAILKQDTEDDPAQTKALIAIFDKYADSDDEALRVSLANNVANLKVDKDHLIEFVKKNNLKVLTAFSVDSLNKLESIEGYAGIKDAVQKAIQDRVKEIFNKDKGNLENLIYLDKIFNANVVCAFDNDTKKQIVESYFTKGKNGEYTFTPKKGQRPTYEQMDKLAKYTAAFGGNGLYDKNSADENKTRLAMHKALVKHVIKCGIDTMGEGQFSEAIEHWCDSAIIRDCYMELIEAKELTPDQLADFITNKMSRYKTMNIDFDKILDKYGDSEVVVKALIQAFGSDIAKGDTLGNISDEAFDKLTGKFIDNNTLNKEKLSQYGIDINSLVKIIPTDNPQRAKKIVDSLDNIDDVILFKDINKDVVRERLGTIFNSNITADMLKKLAHLEPDIIPVAQIFGNLYGKNGNLVKLKECVNKLDDETRVLLFRAIDGNGTEGNKYLGAASTLGIIKMEGSAAIACMRNNLTQVGNKLYDTSNTYSGGTVNMWEYDADAFMKGLDMYNQVHGPGSRKIEQRLADPTYMDKTKIRSVINGFNYQSPGERIVQYITNDGIKQAQVNAIPKALLEYAANIMANNTVRDSFKTAYNNLINFYGAQINGGSVQFTKNNASDAEFSEETAKNIDEMIDKLCNEIHHYEWNNQR